MRIFFVTPEAVPCSRAGGLGDISYHLPRALQALGHEVTVLVPKYNGPEEYDLTYHRELDRSVDLSISNRLAQFYELNLPDAHQMVLVACDELFDRPGIYGNEFGDYDDNAERYIFFSKAVLSLLQEIIDPNVATVVHSHDWPTGLVPLYLKLAKANNHKLRDLGVVFTYHNLANQGTFPYYDFTMTGLDWNLFNFRGLEFHGQLNMTKAGLLGADVISTVSHKYARETLGQEFGHGLEGVLKERQGQLRSVLNGVDYGLWDPARDRFIPTNYGPKDLSGKKACRSNLVDLFGLDPGPDPIVVMVSRLLSRKGFDLVARAMPALLAMPLRLVFMGAGEDQYISFLRETVRQNPGRIGLKLAYDPALTHQIMAGADIFLAPSRFEPCGLEQMYAMKYGAVPVVRATGGLDDTVLDELERPGEGTGYKFQQYTPEELVGALSKAIEVFRDEGQWRSIMLRGMGADFSWEKSALSYVSIYEYALDQAKGENR
ncbi:MAG: glycogen synthase [Deltaproteobacteria bacterium]|jgi:starch synthase|nr:glycogen synthase [Deltaproteobacteria bacterium]